MQVTLLSLVHHKNLVGFLGYSIDEKLHEFVLNGLSHDALFHKTISKKVCITNLSLKEKDWLIEKESDYSHLVEFLIIHETHVCNLQTSPENIIVVAGVGKFAGLPNRIACMEFA